MEPQTAIPVSCIKDEDKVSCEKVGNFKRLRDGVNVFINSFVKHFLYMR